ncbi:264_t:CDS:2 [Entrophospora sp. SA101]|nr:17958_t:CDS:2 [Entrophospora sp. SA101]CAJ0754107.1 338_t:CDS:2 [Entrophospora sp. SA101]CAJ0760266.1 264_t:CDS:2 [Entrophospora sp. SA101]CAJ0845711.1 3180_t:CDS:2 [Entrophospora sp. SA101]
MKILSLISLILTITTTTNVVIVNAQTAKLGQWDFVGDSGISTMHGILSPNTNKTVMNVGGAEAEKTTVQGFNSIRLFDPCDDGTCDWKEYGYKLAKNRWYPSVEQLADGSLFILGGSNVGTAENDGKKNVPSYEFYPPRGDPVDFPFLVETLPYNLYPSVHLLPNKNLFIMANKASIILDTTTWKTAKLPDIPGPPRHYPLTAGTTLLPLSPDNNYDPEVLVCGGSNRNPKVINDGYGEKSCGRISPLSANPKWSMEDMEYGRIMPDIVLMADGNTLILNGCSRGIAGFDIGKDPILVPVIYKPNGVKGSRMETMQPSYIPRMYHSIAFTIPSSQVLVSGSNPNSKVTETSAFPTEYRVEIFSPPFLFTGLPQPEITNAPKTLKYGQKFQIDVTIYKGDNKPKITSNLLNSGFVTHSTHMSQRQIFLEVVEHNENTGKLTLKAPPGSGVAPPGPYLLFVVSDGVPSVGVWVRV